MDSLSVVSDAPNISAISNSSPLYKVIKRVTDISGSLITLVLLAIPFLLLALAIKLDSKGSVFYRQERAKKDGKSFTMLKFRTMVMNAERMGLGFEVARDDARITRVGRVLRAWSLDELPQFYNVLKGEMSLVGPRPARMDQVDHFTPAEKRRMLVKPGLTGWAQVNGRNSVGWKQRIELDLWYVSHESFRLNLKILLKTVWVTYITRHGRYGPEGVTRDYGA